METERLQPARPVGHVGDVGRTERGGVSHHHPPVESVRGRHRGGCHVRRPRARRPTTASPPVSASATVHGCPAASQSSHAPADGRLCKQFDIDAVVVDAIGESETLSVRRGQGRRPEPVHSVRYPHRVGRSIPGKRHRGVCNGLGDAVTARQFLDPTPRSGRRRTDPDPATTPLPSSTGARRTATPTAEPRSILRRTGSGAREFRGIDRLPPHVGHPGRFSVGSGQEQGIQLRAQRVLGVMVEHDPGAQRG
jgi:hypothetical protein